MSNRSRQISKLLIILLVPVLIIGGITRLLSTDAFLAYEYSKAGFPPDSYGFTAEQRFELASANVHYVRAHAPVDALATQTLAGAPVYTAREAAHMADVRAVFQAILRAWQIALVLFLLLGSFLWSRYEKRTLAAALQTGGIVTSAFVLSVGLLAYFVWQAWFNLFHRFFFEAGSWLFDYADTLIRLFPLKFWSDATFTISLLSLAGGILTALIGRLWLVTLDNTPAEITP